MEEANEYAKENFRLKDEVNEMTAKIAPLQSDMNLDKYKSELQAEKKSNLVALNEKDKKIWQANKDQNDKCEAVRGKDGEISMLKAKLSMMECEIEQQQKNNPNNLSFSAGTNHHESSENRIMQLRSELETESDRHSVTRSYYRQVDDACNQEVEEVAVLLRRSGGRSETSAPTGTAGAAPAQPDRAAPAGSATPGTSAPTVADLLAN